MKTLIVGAGVIGVIYGWALAEAGVDVTHFARRGRKESLQAGVALDLLDERKGHTKYNVTRYALKCTEDVAPADGYDLVIVPTNAHQAEDALNALVPDAGEAIFLMFTSNWDGTDYVDRLLPRERYLLGYADGGGTIRDGVYWTNLGAEVHLGRLEGQPVDRLERVNALFVQADMQPDIQANILHWLWVHNAGVVGFAAGFAKHRDLTSYLGDSGLLRECILATREMYGLCRLREVDLGQYPETGLMKLPVWLVRILLRWNFKRNESMQRYTAHAASEGSLRETRYHFDAMLATAESLGFDMPHTRALGTYLEGVTGWLRPGASVPGV